MWKAFNNTYSISSLGYAMNSKTGRVLKFDINSKGYYRVTLSGKRYFIHRVVAILFVPNPLNLPQVNHKDLDKTNNAADNVEWCTNEFNTEHAYLNGRISGRTRLSKDSVEIILSSDKSVKELACIYNVSVPTIYAVKQGLNMKRLGK